MDYNKLELPTGHRDQFSFQWNTSTSQQVLPAVNDADGSTCKGEQSSDIASHWGQIFGTFSTGLVNKLQKII